MARSKTLQNILDSISPADYAKVSERMRLAAKLDDALQERNISYTKFGLMMSMPAKDVLELLAGNIDFTEDLINDIKEVLK